MKKIFLVFLIFLFSLAIFSQAQAQSGLVPCGIDNNPKNGRLDCAEACTFCHFFQLFKNIVDLVMFRLVPAIATLMLVIGGAMFMFSGGNPSSANQGKAIMTSVLWGLILIYAAWLIVSTFLTFIGLSNFGMALVGPDKWFSINCPPAPDCRPNP